MSVMSCGRSTMVSRFRARSCASARSSAKVRARRHTGDDRRHPGPPHAAVWLAQV